MEKKKPEESKIDLISENEIIDETDGIKLIVCLLRILMCFVFFSRHAR